MSLREVFVRESWAAGKSPKDVCYDSGHGILFSIEKVWQSGSVPGRKFQMPKLHVQGVTPEGYSVCLTVDDFCPSLLVIPPMDDWSARDEDVGDDLEGMVRSVNARVCGVDEDEANGVVDEAPQTSRTFDPSRPRLVQHVEHATLERRVRGIGFSNGRKERIVRLHCTSILAFHKVRKTLQSWPEYQVFHEEFSFPIQFFHQTGLRYGDWVRATRCGARPGIAANEGYNIVGSVLAAHLQPADPPPGLNVPPTVKMCLRMRCASQDGALAAASGLVRAGEASEFMPDPVLPNDRLVMLGITVHWSHMPGGAPVRQYLLTLLPEGGEGGEGHPHLEVSRFATERELLERFTELVHGWDPDTMVRYVEEHDPLVYAMQRASVLGLGGLSHRLERCDAAGLAEATYRHYMFSGRGGGGKYHATERDTTERMDGIKLRTRCLINLQNTIKKRNSPELFDLLSVCAMKGVRKIPIRPEDYDRGQRQVNCQLVQGPEGWKRLTAMCLAEMRLVWEMERDYDVGVETASVARISDTDPSDVANGGEQVRVFHSLLRKAHSGGYYMNLSRLHNERPMRLPVRTHSPSFTDPPEPGVVTQLRVLCTDELKKLKQYHLIPQHLRAAGVEVIGQKPKSIGFTSVAKSTGRSEDVQVTSKDLEESERACQGADKSDEEDEGDEEGGAPAVEEMKEGGNVMLPCPRWWGKRKICVLDFASLYPTIMMAYNLCYANIVYDAADLEEGMRSGVQFVTVQIDADTSVVFAQQPGIMTGFLHEVREGRTNVRAMMKVEKDPFKKGVLDKRQLALKVLNNATYGFVGAAADKNAKMPMREIMFAVTSIGRRLQKVACEKVAEMCGRIDPSVTDGRPAHPDVPSNGATVYGDTDSIFVLLATGWRPDEGADDLCRRCRVLYGMPDTFTPELLLNDGVPPDLLAQSSCEGNEDSRHQLELAVMYRVSEKLAHDITKFFPHPVELEMENMAIDVFMDEKKKSYTYSVVGRDGTVAKMKITGMACRRRDWTHWTRGMLMHVQDNLIRHYRFSEISPYLQGELLGLVQGRVPLDDLVVTRGYKRAEDYKSTDLIQFRLAKKMEKRVRFEMTPNTRVDFVVTKGTEPQFMRGETPEIVKAYRLPIDTEYYLKKQLAEPMAKVLQFFPQYVNWPAMVAKYLVICRTGNVVDPFSPAAVAHRKSLAEQVRTEQQAPPHRSPPAASSRVTARGKLSRDPFASANKRARQ